MGGSVARRYARALFGIGVDAGKFEALGDELGELATLWNESDELRQALENPVFKPAEKRAVLEQHPAPGRADARGAALRAAAARSPPHRAAARDRARLPRSDRRARRAACAPR